MTTYWQIIFVESTSFSGGSLQAIYGHLLVQASYIQFKQFSNSGQTRSLSSNELLKCCREFPFHNDGLPYSRAYVRSEACSILFAREGRHFSQDTSRTLTLSESTNIMGAAVQIRLLSYSSGRALIRDTILPNSSTRREQLLRDFSKKTLPERTTLAARARLCAVEKMQAFESVCVTLVNMYESSAVRRENYKAMWGTTVTVQQFSESTKPLSR